MSKFSIGDLVVLKSGSMRMCVEDTSDENEVACLWCHEGVIGRDRFNVALLNKWEHREHDGGHRGAPRGGDRDDRGPRGGGGRSFGGDRDGGGKPYGGGGGGHRGGGDRFDDRPRKTGWDGKPRQKNHYRSDD